ncbi:hypothetical protein ALC57_01974, partial [Trachymyrmex cornetzi]
SNCSCNINANVWASVCPVGLITSAAQLKILSLSPSPSASLETSNACWTLASTCACCNFSHSCSAKYNTFDESSSIDRLPPLLGNECVSKLL